MTLINAAASGLPYRLGPESGAVGMAPYVDPSSGDPHAAAYEQSIDPSISGFVDANAPMGAGYDTGYDSAPVDAQPNVMGVPVDAGGAMRSSSPSASSTGTGYDATIADIAATGVFTESELETLASYGYSPQQLGAIHETAVNSLYGTQQVEPVAVPATIQQIADLGVYTQDELQQLHAASFSPQELGEVYDATIAYMQSPEYAQMQVQEQAQEQAPLASPEAVGEAAAVPTGEPAWNKEWKQRFESAFKEQGLDSKTRMMVISSLRQMGLGEADLQQAFEYYTTNEAGLAELQGANDQVRAGVAMQNKMMLAFGGLALAGGVATTGLAASKANLARALERVATSSADDAARASAQRALDAIRSSTGLTTAMKADAASALRSGARETSRILHPIRTASMNAAARHLTPAAKLSGADVARYGLWMKSGDATADAAAGAASATRAVAGSVDDVAAAAGGAASAARGASMLSKAGKVLGPLGIIASAGFGIWGISKTMEAEGGFGEESAKMTGNVAGGIAGGVAGAAAGAAIGSVVPVIGTGVGAIVGGIVGGIGLGKIGESVGGMLHGLFD
jgi:hypothetical protein